VRRLLFDRRNVSLDWPDGRSDGEDDGRATEGPLTGPRRPMRATANGDLFADGGEYGALLRQTDWAATPLGPPQRWPQSLRAAVRLVLSSRYPMLVFWGDTFSQVYNEAYAGLIGDKHPSALGADVRVTLAEGWTALGPVIDEVLATGVPSWIPALQLLLERSGYREETYFSVSHAVARDDDGNPAGIFTVCSEVTEQVVGERRLGFLRDLGVLPADTRSVERTVAAVLAALAADPLDVPFAALYLRSGMTLRRAGGTGARVLDALPAEVSLNEDGTDPWGLRAAAHGGRVMVPGVAGRLRLPAGAWEDPLDTVLSIALPSSDPAQPFGVLCLGVSPSRALDDAYTSFVDLVAQQVAIALRNARAYEDERQRAESLAELDRAKTQFFTNVSHEFRTPLSLMLGPLTDAIADRDAPLAPRQHDRVAPALNNAKRLLALVNNLLTFSSLQGGRSRAVTTTVDLAALTVDYTSVFRAAAERVGLRLIVDAPPLTGPVLVDAPDWEKIVANLLSNALKFTFVGTIRVRLYADDDNICLAVEDTGVGVEASELPRLFERFHRVQGTRSRSHEGTGIGLALVHELATLYGGTVRVRSTPGAGTTFTVALPWSTLRPGTGAPPAEPQPADQALALAAQAERWAEQPTPRSQPPIALPPPGTDRAPVRILVADDNADMRAYLARLLTEQGWQVDTVADGAAALGAVEENPPDLLLTDVMMPDLDGFELLARLRREPATAALPVVVLTARAGQAHSAELLNLGADDYVVKPFDAADLIARIRATVQLARVRSRHTGQLVALARTASLIASGRALDDAVRAVTEQARLLLDGQRALTVLVRDGQAQLDVAAPAYSAAPPERDTIAVPLRDRQGATLGSLTVWAQKGRRFQPEDHALLEPVGQMLTALAEHSWQLEREQQITATLRRGLLPERLPEVEGVQLAATYLPASTDTAIGGDWYDALTLPDGRLVLIVGDVAGHDINAAVTMGQLRNAARTFIREGYPVTQVVERLNDLATRLMPWSIATCLVAYLDPTDGTLKWCNAGHPPPVLHEPGAAPRWLDGPLSPPLGSTVRVAPVAGHRTLAPGGLLVLYTDGLVEHRDSQLDEGMPNLLARVGTAVGSHHVRAVVDATLPPDRAAQHDDIAVLAARRTVVTADRSTTDITGISRRWTYPATRQAASTMRRDLSRTLHEAGMDDEVVYDLVVAASEAVNNAIEHAQNPTRPQIEFAVDIDAGRAVLTVQDFGSWRSRSAALDRGRGSALMSWAGKVRVVPTATGTTVTIERDLTPDEHDRK
jgi:signal transduction histidine kinase/DNA-binding response OmpR family regulator/serine phosphatase RsbU (regulator of sigma subunit)